MKKIFGGVLLVLGGVIVAATAPSLPARAGVNDFTISDYKIEYHLSKDAEGRSVLKTTERITAEFPNFDQNHGIERAIPKSYDKHPTSLSIDAVTNGSSEVLNYTTYDSNGNLVVRIGDADRYVQGRQVYRITYTQRDVTRYFADVNADEFYWDTNGVEWRVPIQSLSIKLVLDDKLVSALNGSRACYQGINESNAMCAITQSGNEFEASASNLGPGQNLTMAFGFAPQTFAPYQQSPFEIFFKYALIVWFVLIGLSVGLIIWLTVRWSRLSSRKKEIGTIIPEYIPPSDASVTTSASLLSTPRSIFAAQLLDFAVRHYIKIYETNKKILLWNNKDYEIEVTKDVSSLTAEEQEILNDIFGGSAAVGSRLALSSLKGNNSVYMSTLDNDKKLKTLIRGAYGLREKNPEQSRWFKRAGITLLVLAILSFNPGLLVASIVAFVAGATLWPLTDKGLALSRYLEGLKMYIGVAETERLKMLQSPEGAEKVGGVDPNNKKQLVKLYERVLPYATLFGQEKEWGKQLGDLYESTGKNPGWYSSTNHALFNAAALNAALGSFSTAASYSAASSSSSGGSSGGGSSGGGGGGGGGGGW